MAGVTEGRTGVLMGKGSKVVEWPCGSWTAVDAMLSSAIQFLCIVNELQAA